MVVAVAVLELDIVEVVNLLTYGLGGAEIHRCAGYGENLARGHVGRIDGGETLGEELQLVVEDGLRRVAREVEIGVVRHIDHGRGIGLGLVVNRNGVLLRQGEGHLGRKVARELLLAIGRKERKHELRCRGLFHRVELILPAVGTAVEAVTEIVLRQVVLHAIEREFALCDAVGIATNRGTEVRGYVLVVRNLVKTKDHVAHHALAVGNHHRYDAATEGGDADLHAVGIGQGVELGGLVADSGFEIGRIQTREGLVARLRAAGRHQGSCEHEHRNFSNHSYFRFLLFGRWGRI